jgi:hypothetical protein
MGRLKNKIYLVDFNKGKTNLETCLVAKSSMVVGFGIAG